MLEDIIKRTKAYYCLECGICTGSCPVSRHNPDFSPRLFVERALLGADASLLARPDVWSCLTCGTCSARCPSLVDYSEFTRATRAAARERGFGGIDTHAGTILAFMQLQLAAMTTRDLSWISPDHAVSRRGRTLLFTGCLPYFDVVFGQMGVDTLGMANSAIRLMNSCGVRPVVSSGERCCGHDLYWTGDLKGYKKLARHNLKMIEESGARTVVFACPECYSTFKTLYPQHFGALKFDVLHITEFLNRHVQKGKLTFGESDGAITYQDPCRLGRFLGVFDAPRELLAAVPGAELVEMPRARGDAICCGSSAWVSCTRVNKQIQLERLKEAAATGASTLVTSCPKCNIHLACAARDGDLDDTINIKYVTQYLADALDM